MNENRLPLEIIEQILREFVDRLQTEKQEWEAIRSQPYLKASSSTELIKLRLISRTWSRAVIPFYFETISIHHSQRANLVLENWNENLFRPYSYCPVRRLAIKNLWYPEEAKAEDVGQERYSEVISNPVTMDQLAKLIKLLGKNLKTLHLNFTRRMTVSPDLIKAVQTVDDLKSLYISQPHHDWDDIPEGSFAEFLSVIPKLEYLSTAEEYPICTFNSKPPALSNLVYFALHPVNVDSNYDIIQTARKTLKVIEIPGGDSLHGSVLKPIQETLEGLFVFSYGEQIYTDLFNLEFPNLRVFGDRDSGYFEDDFTSSWLQDPIMKNVRTLVCDLSSAGSWIFDPNVTDEWALKKGPDLEHIIFTKHPHLGTQTINPELAAAFESHGIQCHVMNELSAKELMELDLKLNGPMK